jgi:hypothetical protein
LFNRAELARRHRAWYPSEGLLTCAHHTIAWTFQGRTTSPWGEVPAVEGGGDAYVRAAVESARAAGCTRVLLSSEDFCALDRAAIQRLAASLRAWSDVVRIVAYVRRQDLFAESAYNMEVKWWATRLREDFDEYMRSRQDEPDYARILDEWAGVFGVANLVVRSYDRGSLEQGDVRADFCRVAGMSADGLQFADARANESLGPKTLETMRVLNNLDIANAVHEHIAVRLLAYDAKHRSPRCVLFEPEQRRAYLARFESSNARLRAYGIDPGEFELGDVALPARNVRKLTPEEFAAMFTFLATPA